MPMDEIMNFKQGTINLTHGAGGRATAQLIEKLFMPAFDNNWLKQKNDFAHFEINSGRMVMATDAHVVSPLFFPGGDIGSLSVHGTLNDIAMSGAKPLYLSASFILEEGFPLKDLQRIVLSMAKAAQEAGVPIITGDTKVVERGKGDGVFISTTGLGIIPDGITISGNQAKPGDAILINGFIGDHGVAILAERQDMGLSTALTSDTANLSSLVATLIAAVPTIHCLRDPTRGGLATTLNELANQSQVGMLIDEDKIPIRPEVAGVCELLGMDPLYMANEGKLVAICSAEDRALLLETMRHHPLGKNAQIIGQVLEDPYYFVQLKTKLGGVRIMDWLVGDQLPRIC